MYKYINISTPPDENTFYFLDLFSLNTVIRGLHNFQSRGVQYISLFLSSLTYQAHIFSLCTFQPIYSVIIVFYLQYIVTCISFCCHYRLCLHTSRRDPRKISVNIALKRDTNKRASPCWSFRRRRDLPSLLSPMLDARTRDRAFLIFSLPFSSSNELLPGICTAD